MSNIFKNPITLKIHNGTVRSDENLCRNCRHATRMVGALTNRETVQCQHFGILREPVAECNAHVNKNTPHLHDMYEIAWSVRTDRTGKILGFQAPQKEKD